MSSIFFSFIFNRLFIMYYLKICVISYHHKLCTSIHPKSKIFKTRPLSLWLSTIIRLPVGCINNRLVNWPIRTTKRRRERGEDLYSNTKGFDHGKNSNTNPLCPIFIFRNLFVDVEWNGCRRRRMWLSRSKKNGQDWDWEWNQGRLRN